MKSLEPIFVNGMAYTIHELTLGQAIEIAKTEDGKHEKKINKMLSALLNDPALPYEMTLQERHYLIMKYIERQKEVFDIEFDQEVDFNLFEKEYLTPKETITMGNYSFRHLNGFECEALEEYATCFLDWVFGSLALQVSGGAFAEMATSTSRDIRFVKNVIASRVTEIKNLDLTNADELMQSFIMANTQLNNLIDYWFDDMGVLVMSQDIEEGGESKILRFCEMPTLPATLQNLLQGFVG